MSKQTEAGRSDDLSGFTTTLTRRHFLTSAAVLLSTTAWYGKVFAQDTSTDRASNFYKLSKALIGKHQLSEFTCGRILEAMQSDDASFDSKVEQLLKLSQSATTPEALLVAADSAGFRATALAVVTAWYTGTVQTKTGPVLVAYEKALMYLPVSDGLTVPTYCNKGPLWWTGLPPEITLMPTNYPKVL